MTAIQLPVIITLIFLTRQTREMANQTRFVSESLRSGAHGVLSSQVFESNKIFIENPELRPYFYFGKDISEDDPNYNKVIAVAEFLLDYFESTLLQLKHFPQVWPAPILEEYITGSFANSPALCKRIQADEGWYVEELKTLMQTGEARRQQMSPQSDQEGEV